VSVPSTGAGVDRRDPFEPLEIERPRALRASPPIGDVVRLNVAPSSSEPELRNVRASGRPSARRVALLVGGSAAGLLTLAGLGTGIGGLVTGKNARDNVRDLSSAFHRRNHREDGVLSTLAQRQNTTRTQIGNLTDAQALTDVVLSGLVDGPHAKAGDALSCAELSSWIATDRVPKVEQARAEFNRYRCTPLETATAARGVEAFKALRAARGEFERTCAPFAGDLRPLSIDPDGHSTEPAQSLTTTVDMAPEVRTALKSDAADGLAYLQTGIEVIDVARKIESGAPSLSGVADDAPSPTGGADDPELAALDLAYRRQAQELVTTLRASGIDPGSALANRCIPPAAAPADASLEAVAAAPAPAGRNGNRRLLAAAHDVVR